MSEVSGLFAETIDGPTLAAEAGLRYIDDEIPGYCRIGRGRGFSYHTSRGGPARDSEVERFRSGHPPCLEGCVDSAQPRAGKWIDRAESAVKRLVEPE